MSAIRNTLQAIVDQLIAEDFKLQQEHSIGNQIFHIRQNSDVDIMVELAESGNPPPIIGPCRIEAVRGDEHEDSDCDEGRCETCDG